MTVDDKKRLAEWLGLPGLYYGLKNELVWVHSGNPFDPYYPDIVLMALEKLWTDYNLWLSVDAGQEKYTIQLGPNDEIIADTQAEAIIAAALAAGSE